jgi:hypothetical protein
MKGFYWPIFWRLNSVFKRYVFKNTSLLRAFHFAVL